MVQRSINQVPYCLAESGKDVQWHQKEGVRDVLSKHYQGLLKASESSQYPLVISWMMELNSM